MVRKSREERKSEKQVEEVKEFRKMQRIESTQMRSNLRKANDNGDAYGANLEDVKDSAPNNSENTIKRKPIAQSEAEIDYCDC